MREALTAGVISLLLGLCVRAPAVTAVDYVRDIVPGQLGEFVTVSGELSNYREAGKSWSPHTVMLTDGAGQKMRVCVFPDIWTHVSDKDKFATTGTKVLITGEVVDYRDKLELHLQDWEDLVILPPSASLPARRDVTAGQGADVSTSSGVKLEKTF